MIWRKKYCVSNGKKKAVMPFTQGHSAEKYFLVIDISGEWTCVYREGNLRNQCFPHIYFISYGLFDELYQQYSFRNVFYRKNAS